MSVETFICFDYGEKRIGVAVGQTLTDTATPLDTIEVKNRNPDWRKISELLKRWQPHALIVGSPLNMDDSRQEIAELADKFARQLEGRYELQVHRADERLTTYEAKTRLKKQEDLDPVAAQIILESWLHDQRRLSS